MAFDFSAAVSQAQAVVERQENSGSNVTYKYPLVYPPKGQTLIVRPLFNPKSGQIMRLVNRHEKVACYRTYNQECPICKVMQQVQDLTGQDPFGREKKSKSRGVCLAQYISCTQAIKKGNDEILQAGEVVLFMFPWSVYSQINALIQATAQTPTGMDQAFAHANSGLFIQISVDNNFKYTTTAVPYMTFPHPSTDEEFMKLLDSLDDLNEQVLPSTITEETDKQVKEYADAIYRQYIVPRVPQQGTPQVAPVNFSQGVPPVPQAASSPYTPPYSGSVATPPATAPYVPPTATPAPVASFIPGASVTPAVVPAPAPTATSARPACYGSHQDNDPKCICCPYEIECMQPMPDTLPF